ncbi:hypothetical protein I317_06511 [Kwoniella heveanensis CBS 569]|nr:hypothetical protein I317_06511 [Kwoniella heveanensis CBS 569]
MSYAQSGSQSDSLTSSKAVYGAPPALGIIQSSNKSVPHQGVKASKHQALTLAQQSRSVVHSLPQNPSDQSVEVCN